MKLLITRKLDDKHLDTIRRNFPQIQLAIAADREEILREIVDADIVLGGFGLDDHAFKAATRLRWIHSVGAGVDRYIPLLKSRPIQLTCSRGVHPIQISEHVFGLMLCFTRKLNRFLKLQTERRWDRYPWSSGPEELFGKSLGVVGLGAIGVEVARKGKAFGMRVLAVKRTPAAKPEFVDTLLNAEGLDSLLRESDFVVLSVPLTPQTRQLIGEKQLHEMKKTAYLVNICRGEVVDEDCLVRALKDGWIAGGALDVFRQEPLPPDSPLWAMNNVIITPHVAGSSPCYYDRVMRIFTENLGRFVEGRELLNLVDKEAGY